MNSTIQTNICIYIVDKYNHSYPNTGDPFYDNYIGCPRYLGKEMGYIIGKDSWHNKFLYKRFGERLDSGTLLPLNGNCGREFNIIWVLDGEILRKPTDEENKKGKLNVLKETATQADILRTIIDKFPCLLRFQELDLFKDAMIKSCGEAIDDLPKWEEIDENRREKALIKLKKLSNDEILCSKIERVVPGFFDVNWDKLDTGDLLHKYYRSKDHKRTAILRGY